MTLATRCPTCGTAFRVVQDQLKVSDGWVRCGRCTSVFNATESLFDLDAITAPPPPPSPAAAVPPASMRPATPPASTPGVTLIPATPIVATGGLAAAATAPAAPDIDLDAAWGEPAPAPALSVDELHAALFGAATPDATAPPRPDTSAPAAVTAGERAPAEAPAPAAAPPADAPWQVDAAPPAWSDAPRWERATDDAPDGFEPEAEPPAVSDRLDELLIEPSTEPVYGLRTPVETDGVEPAGESDVASGFDPAGDAGDAGHSADGGDAAVAEPLDSAGAAAPADGPMSAPPEETPAALTAADDQADDQADAPAPPAAPAEPATAVEAPAFLRDAERAARWRAPEVRAALAAAVFLLSGAGVLQAARAFHAPVAAQWPGTQTWLAPLCQLAGCESAAGRRIDGLSVESSSLVKVDGSESMRLSVVLRNRDRGPLWLPLIELTLSDTQGSIVARKVLRPAELGATADTLDAGAELTLQAVLDTGEQRVVGYTIELFYP